MPSLSTSNYTPGGMISEVGAYSDRSQRGNGAMVDIHRMGYEARQGSISGYRIIRYAGFVGWSARGLWCCEVIVLMPAGSS